MWFTTFLQDMRGGAFWTLRRSLAGVGVALTLVAVANLLWFAEAYRDIAVQQARQGAAEVIRFMVAERLESRLLERYGPGLNALIRDPELVSAVESRDPVNLREAAADMLRRLRESATGARAFESSLEPLRVRGLAILSRDHEPLAFADRAEALTSADRADVASALSRRPMAQRRQLTVVLWQAPDGRSMHSIVAPVGGFRALGFLEIVLDARGFLSGLGLALGGGVKIRNGSGAVILAEEIPRNGDRADMEIDRLDIVYPATFGGDWVSISHTRNIGGFLDKTRRLTNLTLLIGAVGLIGGATAAFVLAGFAVFSKLREFAAVMLAIGEGRTDAVIPPVGRDEIGAMAAALSTLRAVVIERQQAVTALRDSEQHFRTLVANITGAVYRGLHDTDWSYDFVSDGIEEITGYPASDFLTGQLKYRVLIHQDDFPNLDPIVDAAVANREPYCFEYRIIDAGGETRWVTERGCGVFDEDGRLSYLDGTIYDVTESKVAEQDLRAAKEDAERALSETKKAQARLLQSQKLASLGQMIAGIAHEVKNPLNFVNNFAVLSGEMLKELKQALRPFEADLPEEAREEIDELLDELVVNHQQILDQGKRADSIVKTMLMHSRSAGDKQRTDCNRLVEQAVGLAFHGERAINKDFNIDMQTDLDPNAGEADLAPDEIQRVLINILTNAFHATALKFAAPGAENDRPAIVVTTRDLGGEIEIRIRDNGAGMSAEVAGKLFEPFFTTKAGAQGTGLGLSLSFDIVTRSHSGTIGVDSREGEFAEFVVRLPRDAGAAHGLHD